MFLLGKTKTSEFIHADLHGNGTARRATPLTTEGVGGSSASIGIEIALEANSESDTSPTLKACYADTKRAKR